MAYHPLDHYGIVALVFAHVRHPRDRARASAVSRVFAEADATVPLADGVVVDETCAVYAAKRVGRHQTLCVGGDTVLVRGYAVSIPVIVREEHDFHTTCNDALTTFVCALPMRYTVRFTSGDALLDAHSPLIGAARVMFEEHIALFCTPEDFACTDFQERAAALVRRHPPHEGVARIMLIVNERDVAKAIGHTLEITDAPTTAFESANARIAANVAIIESWLVSRDLLAEYTGGWLFTSVAVDGLVFFGTYTYDEQFADVQRFVGLNDAP